MVQDYHLHTCVSDGEMTPSALLAEAARRGVTHLSITDHDSVGAYLWRDGRVFEDADRLDLDLMIGIEMDTDWDGLEAHVLGFGFDRMNRPLLNHLEHVRKTRVERTKREVAIVNDLLGAETLTLDEVFAPGRETLMRPHLIRPLVERGHFAAYEDAAAWLRENVHAGVTVPKPSIGDAIALLKGAGGWTVLAHPAYYLKSGRDVAEGLPALARLGLDGIELEYPYARKSPERFTSEEETRFQAGLRAVGEAMGLRFTRGSDAHGAADFATVYGS